MKRRISGIGILMIVSMSIFSGCGRNQESETPEVAKEIEAAETEAAETETAETETTERDVTGSYAEDLPEAPDEDITLPDAQTVYMQFLEGEAEASVILEEDMVLEKGEYTLGEISDRYAAFFRETEKPELLKSTKYALIDCGLDGEPELALCMEYTTPDESDITREYLVFKLMDGRLQYITGCNSYNREEVWLNSAGVISASTMYDYYYAKQTERLIDAEGRNYLVYSVQYEMGLEANVIPTKYLPTELRLELDIHFTNLGDIQRTYTLAIYNLEEPPAGDDEAACDEYLRGNRYVFCDEAGNPATPEDEILSLYQEKGLLICEEDEISAILGERKKELGITWEMENAPDIQWTESETSTDRETVKVQWAEDVQGGLPDCESYIPEDAQAMVVFSAESKVKDFKILALSFEEADENGKAVFSAEELYDHGILEPEHPLMAGMTYIGSIPNNGISYVDENGMTRFFAVEVSGYDGSLLLSEIQCR